MTKKTRTILFIICVVLFVLASPFVVFYSQGYRFDFENKKIVQTGAFYFKTLPKATEIYLNGKLKAKTSGLTGSVLIEDLLPKTYDIEIKKDGYHPWQKSLEIKEKQATEAKNIVLIPENPSFALVNQGPEIETSATSSDKKRVVEYNNYEIWILSLETKEKIFLTRFSEKIGKVFWFNNYYLLFNVGDKIKIAEIDDRDGINIVNLIEFENPEIFWSEIDRKLYVLSGAKIYLSENLLP